MRTKERRKNMKRLRGIAKDGLISLQKPKLRVVCSNGCEIKCAKHSSRWSRFVNKIKSIFSKKK